MLKIEDLKVGDVVVNKETGTESIVLSISLKFSHIYVGDGRFILSKNFTYFKKKEQSQYTFDDLIDVANDAVKNKLITQTRFSLSAIGTPLLIVVYFDGREGRYTDDNLFNGIEFIKSLYKETFVIESHEDIRRIKNDANITLSNGNRIEQAVHENLGDYIVFNDSSDDVYTFNFMVLKGATVTQSK